jgi:predicted chitinase
MGGAKGLVLASLVAAGYSTQAQANILANVEKESGFNPRSEEVPKSTKIFSMFGGPEVGKTKDGRPLNKSGNVIRFPTLQDAENIVAAGPEAYFNKVYDGRMGNTNTGDGYKYRGRGFIQITGKDMYQRVGKMIGVDLVSNPDLANQPETAAKIIPAFFKLKAKERKISEDKYNEIDTVNEVVGSADTESKKIRKQLSKSYADQLNSLTKENRDMKGDMSSSSTPGGTAPIIIQNNTTNKQKIIQPPSAPLSELNPRIGN